LRADDLRFTLAETLEYLRQHVKVDLDENQIVHLNKHTRGWAAAIKLAALAIDDARDEREIAAILSGNNPALAEYMEENIVSHLDEGARQLLVRTAHLERMHPALCNFICDAGSGEERLRHLEQSNLVHRTGHDGQWYEYLPIFRSCLQRK